jgi:hypothetical protein
MSAISNAVVSRSATCRSAVEPGSSGPGSGWGDRWWRSRVAQGAFERARHRLLGGVQDAGGLAGMEPEHVVQDDGGALAGRPTAAANRSEIDS